MASDRELLYAWRDGDSEAGNTLLRRHFGAVFRFFVTKVDDAAEDLTQRTFLACVENLDRFREDAAFKTYALGIARRQLLMYFRHKGRKSAPVQLGERSVVELGASPSMVVAEHEEQDLLLAALRRIPADFQISLELYYWEDMTMAEVAEVLAVAEGTIKSRLSRGKEMLRQAVAEMNASEEVLSSTIANLDEWARRLRESLPRKG
jgi:RNA polymerase sigma-70 factor (ECF subfamily)